ncbi:hypothetical protein H671_2g6808, partial [Cricetulus griseus]
EKIECNLMDRCDYIIFHGEQTEDYKKQLGHLLLYNYQIDYTKTLGPVDQQNKDHLEIFKKSHFSPNLLSHNDMDKMEPLIDG